MSSEIALLVDDAYASLVQRDELVAVALATLALFEGDYRVTVVITDDERVRELNREYRHVDAPTDVLSFAAQESSPAEPEIAVLEEMIAELDSFLGDIIIAFPYAARQAIRYHNSLEAELRLLVAHGTLHLLGYDHGTPEEEAEMWALTAEVLAPFGDTELLRRHYEES